MILSLPEVAAATVTLAVLLVAARPRRESTEALARAFRRGAR